MYFKLPEGAAPLRCSIERRHGDRAAVSREAPQEFYKLFIVNDLNWRERRDLNPLKGKKLTC